MDAATWLRQLGGDAVQAEKRAQIAQLSGELLAMPSLDSLLFDGMEKVSTFFAAEHAAVFVPDRDNHLRAVAWIGEGVRELRLPREPSNLIG